MCVGEIYIYIYNMCIDQSDSPAILVIIMASTATSLGMEGNLFHLFGKEDFVF